MIRLSELTEALGGELRGGDAEFSTVGIDTRTLKPGDLYVAIRGARFDGNEFVAGAAAQGAVAAIVERFAEADLPQLKVPDGRLALGRLGTLWRERWGGRIVAITGSNGKTTVKEMTSAVLETAAPTLRTRGNLNNDIGVPLTLLELKPEHKFGVIEMGANHHGEIAYLVSLGRPEVAILANAGAAHLEGFGSLDGVAEAKGEIIGGLGADGIAVLNADDRYFDFWLGLAGQRRVCSFGLSERAVVRADPASIRTEMADSGFRTAFDLLYEGQRHPMSIGVTGRHNVVNALAAAAAAFSFGLAPDNVRAGFAAIKPVPGRLEPVRGRRGALLINDAYNGNPTSVGAALDVLAGLPGEHWIALGALGELGENSAELHAEIGRDARASGASRLYTCGPNAENAAKAFGEGGVFFESREELIARLDAELAAGITLLVKGSHSQRMEQVIEALAEKDAPCC
jgi:UDP-N-acetylmuramoyl-tripeptide--D-alanyl-D-alanine ligase